MSAPPANHKPCNSNQFKMSNSFQTAFNKRYANVPKLPQSPLLKRDAVQMKLLPVIRAVLEGVDSLE